MKIHIPTPLRTYTGGQETVDVAGRTVADALEHLTAHYPELQQQPVYARTASCGRS